MLEIKGLGAGYGKKQVLFGISLEVHQGEVVALIGPNGAGKSTLLKTVHGLVPARKGSIRFNGAAIDGCSPFSNVERGITLAPQGNRVFAGLTVRENLEIGGSQLSRHQLRSRVARMFELFPVLQARAKQSAWKLSGGEQQILSLARALVPNPKLLMLDEPTLGLSPNLAAMILSTITELNEVAGVTILVVEHKVREIMAVCTRVYGLRLGAVVFEGPPGELADDRDKVSQIFF